MELVGHTLHPSTMAAVESGRLSPGSDGDTPLPSPASIPSSPGADDMLAAAEAGDGGRIAALLAKGVSVNHKNKAVKVRSILEAFPLQFPHPAGRSFLRRKELLLC